MLALSIVIVGADVNAKNLYGEIPLMRAIEKDRKEIIIILEQAGAK